MSIEELENIENTEESKEEGSSAPKEEVPSDSDDLHTVVHLSGMYQDWLCLLTFCMFEDRLSIR